MFRCRSRRSAGERLQILGYDLIAWPEPDIPDTAIGGDVLVLLTNGLAAAIDLDGAGAIGQLFRRHLPAAVREERMQQAHRNRGGRAKSGAAR